MKKYFPQVGLLLLFALFISGRAQEPAVVMNNTKINVRGQPSLNSEVVTQLQKAIQSSFSSASIWKKPSRRADQLGQDSNACQHSGLGFCFLSEGPQSGREQSEFASRSWRKLQHRGKGPERKGIDGDSNRRELDRSANARGSLWVCRCESVEISRWASHKNNRGDRHSSRDCYCHCLLSDANQARTATCHYQSCGNALTIGNTSRNAKTTEAGCSAKGIGPRECASGESAGSSISRFSATHLATGGAASCRA
jgi:hypothetical protein